MARILGAAILAIAALGCGSATPSPMLTLSAAPTAQATPSPAPPVATLAIEHPTGSTDVVLRMSSGGGLRWHVGPTYDNSHQFTLYWDGRAIYYTWPGGMPPEQLSPLLAAQLTEEQVAALIEFALDDGGLAAARSEYFDASISDASTTDFQIDAGGFRKTVSVYALGYVDDENPDAAARRAMDLLESRLIAFGELVASGEVAGLGEFRPDTYGLTLTRIDDPELTPSSDWPWPDLDLADFGPLDDGGRAYIVVEAAVGEAVLALDKWDNVIVTASDGANYEIKVHPLLPDEEAFD